MTLQTWDCGLGRDHGVGSGEEEKPLGRSSHDPTSETNGRLGSWLVLLCHTGSRKREGSSLTQPGPWRELLSLSGFCWDCSGSAGRPGLPIAYK